MAQSQFVYVTFIRTTPDRLWAALREREFTEKYWFGAHLVSDWKAGSSWKIIMKDG
ncbi:MAG: SRPBCC domain-containing protein, partial [Proteobacteria bacterium]|nr:SRPBCC domain-containing protein [Pseudomonadota bacterium]